MADKDVQRNVRSSSEEGVQTPRQKHYHLPGEKDNFPLDKPHHEKAEKKSLLEKFKEREKKWAKKTLKPNRPRRSNIQRGIWAQKSN